VVVATEERMVYGRGMTQTSTPKFDINIYFRKTFGDPATPVNPEDESTSNYVASVYEWEDGGVMRARKHIFSMFLNLNEADYFEDDWFTEHTVDLPQAVHDRLAAQA
jgi:hypothetical protein